MTLHSATQYCRKTAAVKIGILGRIKGKVEGLADKWDGRAGCEGGWMGEEY